MAVHLGVGHSDMFCFPHISEKTDNMSEGMPAAFWDLTQETNMNLKSIITLHLTLSPASGLTTSPVILLPVALYLFLCITCLIIIIMLFCVLLSLFHFKSLVSHFLTFFSLTLSVCVNAHSHFPPFLPTFPLSFSAILYFRSIKT